MTVAAYRERYPKAPIVSRKLREAMVKRVNSPEVRERARKAASKELTKRWREDSGYRSKMVRVSSDKWKDSNFRERQAKGARISILERQEELKTACHSPKVRRATSRRLKKVWKDPEYRRKMSKMSSDNMTIRWQNPDFRKAMKPLATKWTKPEKEVMGWLKKMGLYRTGKGSSPGFLPHRWLPTKGFTANADFVDYNHRLIIHVDGCYWHGIKKVASRDERLDSWCSENGWRFVRLTDLDIAKKPKTCRNKIRRLLRGANL